MVPYPAASRNRHRGGTSDSSWDGEAMHIHITSVYGIHGPSYASQHQVAAIGQEMHFIVNGVCATTPARTRKSSSHPGSMASFPASSPEIS